MATSVDRGTRRMTNPSSLRTKGWAVLVSALMILLVACGTSAAGPANGGPPGPNGGATGDFPISVYTGASAVGGDQINFSDLEGPIVLNFWAGLCPPCRAEMPDLQEFYEDFKDDALLIGVDVGQFTGLGNETDAVRLLEELEITYPTGFTTDGGVMQEFGVLSMPTTVFITADGEVFRKWSGALNRETLEEITNEMLSSGVPASG